MNNVFAYLVAIIAFVIVLNFFMLFMRLKRDKAKKSAYPAAQEEQAAVHRHREIQRRLDREQEELAHIVEMRNKTFEIYAQVRKQAAQRDR